MSAAKGADGSFNASVQPDSANRQSSDAPSLTDLSEKDKPWDKHRFNADRVQDHYWRSAEFENYARRVSECAQLLEFKLKPDAEAGLLKLKLSGARFCRVRHCPVCQWRRSLMWKAKAYKVLPKIVEKYPKHRWLFVTLTLKNCEITELRETLKHMNKSFQRMSQRKLWPADGWLRSTEVTLGRNRTAHPHFHCLLMVPSGYFGPNYISQAKWVELWRSCARLDYNPVMDVRAVKRNRKPMDLVPEILKYCTKESDMVADREWFLELTRQMFKLRCIGTGGILKDYLQALEAEPDDLIHVDEESEDNGPDEGSLYFGWKRFEKKYRLKDY